MRNEAAIAAMWQGYLDTLPEDRRPAKYIAWSFGDSPQLADDAVTDIPNTHL